VKFSFGKNYKSKLEEVRNTAYELRKWRRRYPVIPVRLSTDGPKKEYVCFQWIYVSYPDADVIHSNCGPSVFLGRALRVEKLPND
jgi:hypothetical protein